MYYSNSSIGPRSYSNLQSAVYSSFDRQVFQPKYHGMHNVDDFYQKTEIKEDYKPKKKEDNKDVVFVDDMAFDLFLRFSPLLRSLESKKVKEIYGEFLKDKGKLLLKFLKDKGRHFIDLVGFARMKLEPNAIAAVIRTGDRAILAVNNDFDEKVFNFAKHNDISIKDAITYIFSHETVHLADEHSEKTTEKLVGDFFNSIKMKELRDVAYRRSEEVHS
ncbi:hypothetical protein KY328_00230 [Candidatus Woesearchaeota archaeon]|nr:hypothetical protein [Candidatus Woesearchaeota archaeon]MBW3021324.1 hypothetical protein [Candidatus Woesearchaeota archaeon]